MGEVAGLPAAGPTTRDAVKAMLTPAGGAYPAAYDAAIDQVVGAVNAIVRQMPVASDSLTYGTPPPSWPPYVTQGATMLAARLWRRKDSPAGVIAVTDQAFAYVQRNDPDVALLLKMGQGQVG